MSAQDREIAELKAGRDRLAEKVGPLALELAASNERNLTLTTERAAALSRVEALEEALRPFGKAFDIGVKRLAGGSLAEINALAAYHLHFAAFQRAYRALAAPAQGDADG